MPNGKQPGKQEKPHQTLYAISIYEHDKAIKTVAANRSICQIHAEDAMDDKIACTAFGLGNSGIETGTRKIIPVLDVH